MAVRGSGGHGEDKNERKGEEREREKEIITRNNAT
jgi:hypothetical protein